MIVLKLGEGTGLIIRNKQTFSQNQGRRWSDPYKILLDLQINLRCDLKRHIGLWEILSIPTDLSGTPTQSSTIDTFSRT
jgi:hypothetical protein